MATTTIQPIIRKEPPPHQHRSLADARRRVTHRVVADSQAGFSPSHSRIRHRVANIDLHRDEIKRFVTTGHDLPTGHVTTESARN